MPLMMSVSNIRRFVLAATLATHHSLTTRLAVVHHIANNFSEEVRKPVSLERQMFQASETLFMADEGSPVECAVGALVCQVSELKPVFEALRAGALECPGGPLSRPKAVTDYDEPRASGAPGADAPAARAAPPPLDATDNEHDDDAPPPPPRKKRNMKAVHLTVRGAALLLSGCPPPAVRRLLDDGRAAFVPGLRAGARLDA